MHNFSKVQFTKKINDYPYNLGLLRIDKTLTIDMYFYTRNKDYSGLNEELIQTNIAREFCMDGDSSFSVGRCRAPLDALINCFELETGDQILAQQDYNLQETQR